jgi:hypothetical protein
MGSREGGGGLEGRTSSGGLRATKARSQWWGVKRMMGGGGIEGHWWGEERVTRAGGENEGASGEGGVTSPDDVDGCGLREFVSGIS